MLRTHVSGCAYDLVKIGEQGLVGQRLRGGFRDPEINHFEARLALDFSDQDVRGLEVAVNNSFLMGVLNSVAYLDK